VVGLNRGDQPGQRRKKAEQITSRISEQKIGDADGSQIEGKEADIFMGLAIDAVHQEKARHHGDSGWEFGPRKTKGNSQTRHCRADSLPTDKK
jgi:hypothetical protein